MKNVGRFFIGALVLFMLVASGIASADSLTVSTEQSSDTITFVFGDSPVFDPVPPTTTTDSVGMKSVSFGGAPLKSPAVVTVSEATSVPEPSTLILLGLGVFGLLGLAQRKKH